MSLEFNKIYCVDCLEGLKKLDDDSIDSVVTDPPYGLGFMGKEWDTFDSTQHHNLENEKSKLGGFKHLPRYKTDGLYEFSYNWSKECLRVLKPGGYLLSFGGTRTYHRMACAIEDAGFEIRDQMQWIYGSGFPKSLNIGKAIDKISKRINLFEPFAKYLKEQRISKKLSVTDVSKMFPSKSGGLTGCVSNWELGYNVPTKEQFKILKKMLALNDKFDDLIDRVESEREIIGKKDYSVPSNHINASNFSTGATTRTIQDITAPATEQAKKWEGWGTALKPANEPICVARKPLSEKTVAQNVLKWGCGGINIDACRIKYKNNKDKKDGQSSRNTLTKNTLFPIGGYDRSNRGYLKGRFPANVILDEEAGKMLDEQSGIKKSVKRFSKWNKKTEFTNTYTPNKSDYRDDNTYSDKGGASRFFYCAKASKSERNQGLDGFEEKQYSYDGRHKEIENAYQRNKSVAQNNHPTVKPVKLMEYLVRLVTPKKGIVLDPFMGSGTTGMAAKSQGFNYIGFDKTVEYCKIAEARIKSVEVQKKLVE